MLVRTDPDRGRTSFLSIPRDLRVDVPGHGFAKINAAYQFGGQNLAVQTVKAFTGLQVNHVVVVDFRSFEQLIDALGGVTIDVPEPILSNRFDCPFSTQERCQRWNGWRFAAGEQTMSGRRALVYSRVRENRLNPAENDLTRGERQQAVVRAIGDELTSFSTLVRLPFLADDLIAPLATDLSAGQFGQLAWVKVALGLDAALPARRDADLDRRRVVPDRQRGEPERDPDVPGRRGTAAAAARHRALRPGLRRLVAAAALFRLRLGLRLRLRLRRLLAAASAVARLLAAAALARAAVVGRVEPRALEVDGDGVEARARPAPRRRPRTSRAVDRPSAGRPRTRARSGNGIRRSAPGETSSVFRGYRLVVTQVATTPESTTDTAGVGVRGSVVRVGRRRLRARRRHLSLCAADRVAAARGRDARALRRPAAARPAARHRARGARRRAAPLSPRRGGGALGRRADRAPTRLRALRAREPAAHRAARRAARRPSGRVDHDRARLRELGAAVPRRLRPDVQPVPLHERALVPRAALGDRPRRRVAVRALGPRGDRVHREPSVRRARARLAGPLRPARAAPRSRGASSRLPRSGSRHAVLARRPPPREPLRRRRGRQRERQARRAAAGAPLPEGRRRRLHRGLVGAARPDPRARRVRRARALAAEPTRCVPRRLRGRDAARSRCSSRDSGAPRHPRRGT